MNAITTTAPITTIIEGDAVKARFLMTGNIVIVDACQFVIGVARCDSDTHVTFSTVNHLGGIEALTFGRDEWVQLATEV